MKPESVNHPNHYGGKDNVYEVIKIIEHYNLGFCLGNVLKYILRAPFKASNMNFKVTLEEAKKKEIEDLKKAVWYLNRHIMNIEKRDTNETK